MEELKEIESLREEIDTLIRGALTFEADHCAEFEMVASEMRSSARNLLHYLSLRQHDLRPLQERLRKRGLSSLGRLEPCVLRTLTTMRSTLDLMAGRFDTAATSDANALEMVGFDDGPALLRARAARLFGPGQEGRDARIMVTMPSEAADDPGLIHRLVEAGMDVMRINCAHDGPDAWRAMIAHLRTAERALGRRVVVSADLAGPKVRTGPPGDTVNVVKLSPRRGPTGEVLTPCVVPAAGDPRLPLPPELLVLLESGDELEIRDARGKWRTGVVGSYGNGLGIALTRTAYLTSGAALRLHRGGELIARGALGELPPREVPLRLNRGETLRLLRRVEPGPAGSRQIGCSLPEALDAVERGHSVWFDDGRIGGRVVNVDSDGIDVEVTQIRESGANLRAGKGINLPDTRISLPVLGADDLTALRTLASGVDLIGMSFVRSPADVFMLQNELEAMGAGTVAVELKIENRQAFEHLPHIMLAAMRRGPFAVMVARGDLAVEVGFERLAEVQEEILWLAEAAHAPVIWATQVLEGMAQRGAPSRAEVTDAAMSERAECVMLNKGPYVCDAVRFLDGVLRRMQGHQYKKRSMLRRLNVSALA
jgi:pyruvate kinase